MKKTILWGALFTLIGTQVYAEQAPAAAMPAQAQNPATKAPAPASAPTPVPAAPQLNTENAPVQALPEAPRPAAPNPVINCESKIPAQTQKIEKSYVLKWAEQAVTQAFSFNPDAIEAEMQKLQPCFTEQGWTGFSTALQKSGNVEAIKSQKLHVSSQIDGMPFINETKENQWKLTLPLSVTYQNEKEKVSQLLSVDLTVSRKPTGDLGITQMIATPRGTVTTTKPNPVSNPENTNLDTKPPAEKP